MVKPFLPQPYMCIFNYPATVFHFLVCTATAIDIGITSDGSGKTEQRPGHGDPKRAGTHYRGYPTLCELPTLRDTVMVPVIISQAHDRAPTRGVVFLSPYA